MSFNSVSFLVFFPLVTLVYFRLPPAFRNLFLLAASCYFYMSFIPFYILFLVLIIVIDYVAGINIERSSGPTRKKWLLLSLAGNLAILLGFKFFFVISAFAHFFNLDDAPVFWTQLALPIGLSFHTFQAMSYTLEVYRGNWPAQRRFTTYALYVLFYPQLVAGPIERPAHLMPQFDEVHSFEEERVVQGLRLMLWGMFKKVVIADRLAVPVNEVYGHPAAYQGFPLAFATVCFAFQIFCDFSGYSDIAIGAAQVMGFRLVTNFDRPYLSASIREFWTRWHISLSSWFRDYVYIPLGGNRRGTWRRYLNLMVTFLLSGLWHGSRWTFAFWGALNGFYLVFGLATADLRKKAASLLGLERRPALHHLLQVAVVFSLTCFAWIFFRANSLSDAFTVAARLPRIGANPASWGRNFGEIFHLGLTPVDFGVLLAALGLLEWVHLAEGRRDLREALSTKPAALRWGVYYLLSGSIALTWIANSFQSPQFIYFQF